MIFNYIPVIFMTLVSSFASLFLKKAATNNYEQKNFVFKLFQNRNIYIGAVLYCIAAILNISAFHFLEYSVVVPLGALTYLWTSLISYIFLNERITMRSIRSIFLIIIGVIVITV